MLGPEGCTSDLCVGSVSKHCLANRIVPKRTRCCVAPLCLPIFAAKFLVNNNMDRFLTRSPSKDSTVSSSLQPLTSSQYQL
jgi:hypothetical protein